MPSPDAPAENDLYVNYLPTPRRDRRFLRFYIPGMLWLIAIVAIIWARAQPTTINGVWEDGRVQSFTGLVLAHPYPMLITSDNGAPRTLLLVEVGKRGAQSRIDAHDGALAQLSGWVLHREGRTILELEPGDAYLKPADPTAAAPAALSIASVTPGSQRLTIRGEIVDSKCFLGAMKPGQGKAHKACATLCVTGGIPPVLIAYDKPASANAPPRIYLLMGEHGGPLDPALRAFIADPVEITGTLSTVGDLNVLSVAAKDVRRL